MSRRKKEIILYWYKPCEHCGYKTNLAASPKNGIKYCWQCGRTIYRDYDKGKVIRKI